MTEDVYLRSICFANACRGEAAGKNNEELVPACSVSKISRFFILVLSARLRDE